LEPEQAGNICSSGFAVLTPKGIPSELLFAYLRLPVICELMDLHTTASMYPAISTTDPTCHQCGHVGSIAEHQTTSAKTWAEVPLREHAPLGLDLSKVTVLAEVRVDDNLRQFN